MLNEALRLIRVYHDLKQSEAAERLGVSKSYLSEIEANKKKPSLELLGRYSEAFGIPISSIMFFSENIDATGASSKTRLVVAAKVVNFLKFLESKSGRTDVETADQLSDR